MKSKQTPRSIIYKTKRQIRETARKAHSPRYPFSSKYTAFYWSLTLSIIAFSLYAALHSLTLFVAGPMISSSLYNTMKFIATVSLVVPCIWWSLPNTHLMVGTIVVWIGMFLMPHTTLFWIAFTVATTVFAITKRKNILKKLEEHKETLAIYKQMSA